MKTIKFLLSVCLCASFFSACNDVETYADKKDKERKAINVFIKSHGINVISEADFKAAGEVTDTARNEYVLFSSSGVYMQILRKGSGKKIAEGENANVLCRFTEWNLLQSPDSIKLSNNVLSYAASVDEMKISNESGTIKGAFIAGSSLMYSVYGGTNKGGTSVPSGWLEPFKYVNIGRLVNADDELAKVRLIVPHTSGQYDATNKVYPCLYELTYERAL